MKKIIAIGIGIGIGIGIVACAASSAFAADTVVPLSNLYYVSGNNYERLSVPERAAYVTGVLDGLLGSWAMEGGVASKHVTALVTCLKNIPSDQALAVVDKYMTDNPSRWDFQMNALVYNALNEMCRTRGTPIWP